MKIFSGLLCLAVMLTVSSTQAATIAAGDVTSNLDGTIFFDDARTGGSDATINEGQVQVVNRFLDYDGNGTIAAPGVGGVVEIDSFGFATSGATAANDASEVDITIIYLGANENLGAGDDVVLGTQRVGYNHTGGGEYFVDFDTPFTASIDGLGSRYRIEIRTVDNDPVVNESIRFKSRPANEQSFGHQGATMSMSGSYTVAAIPEPSSLLLMLSLLGTASFGCCRR